MPQSRALVIEDDKKLVSFFTMALQVAGFDADVASDGLTALDWLAHNIPDVVILDLHLPFISGKKILQKIRADERMTQTRVIVATADSIMADELRTAADFILLKPISFFHLHNMVKGL